MSPRKTAITLLNHFHLEDAYEFVQSKLDEEEDKLFWFDVLLELNSESPPKPPAQKRKTKHSNYRLNDADKINNLSMDFLAPPINVINMMQGHIRDLEQKWAPYNFIVEGRDNDLIGTGLSTLFPKSKYKTGTSRFSPAICEIMYSWFCPKGGLILDSFAGGSVRGLVATELGYQYIGIDLSFPQVLSNIQKAKKYPSAPIWIHGDSTTPLFISESFDFLFTSPPYFDLEIYSNNSADLSNKTTYPAFLDALSLAISTSACVLKPNRFAVMVVGDIRDRETGFYRNFPGDVISIFRNNELNLYNKIYLYHIGSGHLRCRQPFMKSRKITKVQQTALVFVKGDPIKATRFIKESSIK